jgi:hypothetical protein
VLVELTHTTGVLHKQHPSIRVRTLLLRLLEGKGEGQGEEAKTLREEIEALKTQQDDARWVVEVGSCVCAPRPVGWPDEPM